MRISLPPRNADGSYTTEPAGMKIDADGARNVYGPAGTKPLDYLANAGGPSNWYGIVTDTGKANGKPIIQGPNDPFPGYYVSATSYEYPGFRRGDPKRYVDADSVIYIVLPGHWRSEAQGIVLGCNAKVHDTKTGRTTQAAVLDFGPKGSIGEASIACARYFGIPNSPKNGGTDEKRFVYTFFPGTAAPGFELQPM